MCKLAQASQVIRKVHSKLTTGLTLQGCPICGLVPLRSHTVDFGSPLKLAARMMTKPVRHILS